MDFAKRRREQVQKNIQWVSTLKLLMGFNLAGVGCPILKQKQQNLKDLSVRGKKSTRDSSVSSCSSAHKPPGWRAQRSGPVIVQGIGFTAPVVLLPAPSPAPSPPRIMGSHISSTRLLLRPSRAFYNLSTRNRVAALLTVKSVLWGRSPLHCFPCLLLRRKGDSDGPC